MRFVVGVVCAAAVFGSACVSNVSAVDIPTIPAGLIPGAGAGAGAGAGGANGNPLDAFSSIFNAGGIGGTAGAGAGTGVDICTALKGSFAPLTPQGFPESIPNPPALPSVLDCIQGSTRAFLQIILKLKIQTPNDYPSATSWRDAGWPSSTATPLPSAPVYDALSKTLQIYSSVFGSSGIFNGGGGVISIGTGSGGDISINIPGMSAGAGAGAGAGGLFPGGFPDFNSIFNTNTLKPCTVSCPPSTLCMNGNQCITPQPICSGCNSNQFCQSTLNTTLLAAFNAQATAAAFANAHSIFNGQVGSGSASAGAGAGSNINFNFPAPPALDQNGRPIINAGANGLPDFNSLLSLIQDNGQVNGTCQSLTPKCSSCPSGQVCSPFEGCVQCDACGSIDLSAVLRGGFDPSRFTGNQQVRGNGTQQHFGPGIITQIQAGLNEFTNFVFGSLGSSSSQSGSAITAFEANAQAQINQLLSNLQDATIQLAGSAQVLSRELKVALNATLALVLQNGAKAGCNQTLDINGPLIIRGIATAKDIADGMISGVFNFPPTSNNNKIGANAIVNIIGGAGITGDIGGLQLSISAAAAAAAAASVPAGEFLRTSGAVLGADAKFIVKGALQLAHYAFQPILSISSAAFVNITSNNFTCGPLDLTSGGNLDIQVAGAKTFFKNLTQCAGGASIRIKVTSIASVQSGAVLFSYSSTTEIIRKAYKCGVTLYDDTGATLSLRNTNLAATSGRRLLESTGTATVSFDETGATYKNTNAGGNGGNNAATTAQAPTLMCAVMFVAAAVARML